MQRLAGVRRAAAAWACVPAMLLGLSGCNKDSDSQAPAAEPPANAAPTGAAGAAKAAPTPAPANPHAGAVAHGQGQAAAPPSTAPKRADGKTVLGGLAVAVPEGWTQEPVRSRMRKAQWKIDGEAGPAELVVYHFGQAGAGSVEKNLERWYGQFQQADGSPTKDAAEVTEKSVDGMRVTRVEVGGRYVAAVRPGANERHDIPEARMLAAIIDAADGSYYFKMVGPDSTVKSATAGFDSMLDSLSKNES